MTKILFLAAASSVGKHLTPCLLDNTDSRLTLFARKASTRLSHYEGARVKLVDGDIVLDTDKLDDAMANQDIVILAESYKDIVEATITAMHNHGVKRIIVPGLQGIEGEGIGEVAKYIAEQISNDEWTSYLQGFAALRESDLDYTYLRMPELYDAPTHLDYVLEPKAIPADWRKLSFQALSEFILTIVKDPSQHVRSVLGIYEPGTRKDP